MQRSPELGCKSGQHKLEVSHSITLCGLEFCVYIDIVGRRRSRNHKFLLNRTVAFVLALSRFIR